MLPTIELIKRNNFNWLLMKNSDLITSCIRKGKNLSKDEIIICSASLHNLKNPIVIDVGANIGTFTIEVAKLLMKHHGKIYSFEPQRIIFQSLCANIFINQLDNVYSYNVALGNKKEKIEIPELDLFQSKNIGGFSIEKNIRENLETIGNQNIEKTNQFYKIQKNTLDTYSIDKIIAFIKADVEGHELEFFQGAINTLKNNYFPPIIFEAWSGEIFEWHKKKSKTTFKYLEKLGYKFKKIGLNYLAQNPIHNSTIEFKENNGVTDINLVRK